MLYNTKMFNTEICSYATILRLPSVREQLFCFNVSTHCLVCVYVAIFVRKACVLPLCDRTRVQCSKHISTIKAVTRCAEAKVTLSLKAVGLFYRFDDYRSILYSCATVCCCGRHISQTPLL